MDSQYSQYYLRNPLQLSLNQEGVVSKSDDLTYEQRYSLHKNINQRELASRSILQKSQVLKKLTEDLIIQLESALKKKG